LICNSAHAAEAAIAAMGLVVRGIELCSNLGFGDERT